MASGVEAKAEAGFFSFETAFKSIPYALWGYRIIKNIYNAKKNNYRLNDLTEYVTKDKDFFLNSVSTPIAYQMTNALINYASLSESGLKITGSLPTESSFQEKGLTGEDAFSGISKEFSLEAQRQAKESVKQGRIAKIFGRNVSDEDIASQMESLLREKVENICIGMTLKYDEEKMSEVRADVKAGVERYNNNKKDFVNVGKYGGAITTALTLGTIATGGTLAVGMPLVYGALGAAVGLGIGGVSGSIVANKVSEDVHSRNQRKGVGRNQRQNITNDEKTKKDIVSIVSILKSQAKKIKKINDAKYIHVNSLSSLLFENAKISDDDIKKLLRASNVSIYSFMSQSDKKFRDAEADLVASVKDLLEVYFGISVAKTENNSKRSRNIQAHAVANTSLSQETPAGQQSCPAMAPYTQMIPMPHNINQQIQNPLQIANIMSMSGGMNMFYFMMMMMQSPMLFQQMMQNMQGMTVKEAVSEMENKIPELNDLEKSMEIAVKKINTQKPFLTKDKVRKIFYTFKKSNIINVLDNLDSGVEAPSIINSELFNDEQMFIASIRSQFNIIKDEASFVANDQTVTKLSTWIKTSAFSYEETSNDFDVIKIEDLSKLIAKKILGLQISFDGTSNANDDVKQSVINNINQIKVLSEELLSKNKILKGSISKYLFS